MSENLISGPFELAQLYRWEGKAYGPGTVAQLPCSLAKQLVTASVIPPLTPTQLYECAVSADARQFVQLFDTPSSVIKQSGGGLIALIAINNHTAQQWIQFFDKAAVPEAGDTPRISLPLAADGGGFLLDQTMWGEMGLPFLNGISWGISSTRTTFTAGTALLDVSVTWF